jgi:hypothetical protein
MARLSLSRSAISNCRTSGMAGIITRGRMSIPAQPVGGKRT